MFTMFSANTSLQSNIIPEEKCAFSPFFTTASQGSSMTSKTTSRGRNRLSLSFPIQTNDYTSQMTSQAVSELSKVSPGNSLTDHQLSVSTEANAFLTALAAQERRVLEVREELQKAELELAKLKKQWAIHEAAKKRNEMRQVEPLRALASPTRSTSPKTDKQIIVNREQGRRDTVSTRAKQPPRKVFSGSRHTRTLSLLSPTTDKIALSSNMTTQRMTTIDKSNQFKRSAAISDTNPSSGSALQVKEVLSQPSTGAKDDLVHTGKQLVGDLRKGLWNFIEDLRQATVGEDAVGITRRQTRDSSVEKSPARNHSKTRAKSSVIHSSMTPKRSAKVNNPTTTSVKNDDSSAWDKVVNAPREAPGAENCTLSKSFEPGVISSVVGTTLDDGGWDNWRSPSPRAASPGLMMTTSQSSQMPSPTSTQLSSPSFSTSTFGTPRITSPSPVESSPRTSIRYLKDSPVPFRCLFSMLIVHL